MEVASVATRISDVQVYNCDYADGAAFFMGEWNGSESCVEDLNVPHRHNGYSIDILIRGRIRQSIDFKTFTRRSGRARAAPFISCERLCSTVF